MESGTAMTSPTDNEIIEQIVGTVLLQGERENIRAQLREKLPIITKRAQEAVLRKLWAECDRPAWLYHWIVTQYGIDLEGEGNA
jgi:hypothetical protein